MTTEPSTPRRFVQCGWCPIILPNYDPADLDASMAAHDAWYRHFARVHRYTGFSVKPIKGSDWDVSELSGP